MSGRLGLPLGSAGTGRARYARAMACHVKGRLSDAQLEAYRVAAASDTRPPEPEFAARGLPVPQDLPGDGSSGPGILLDEISGYLRALPGPGVAEVRAGLAAARRHRPVEAAAPMHNAVVAAHLPAALAALKPDHPALADAITAAAPHLGWCSYDAYDPALIGGAFRRGHAFASLIGAEGGLPEVDFDMGLFLIAPQVFYRDHHHPAPELYAPLTGPHGWRFGPGRPLVRKPAHQPVWNPAGRPHAIKVGAVPLLCLYAWTRDIAEAARVIPANDWPELEALHLD